MTEKNARILLAIGATGTGKTTWLTRELKRARPRSLFVWEQKADYARALNIPMLEDWAIAARALAKMRAGAALRFGFRPPITRRAAMLKMFARVLEEVSACQDLDFVVEDAGTVLEPGTGNPHAWHNLVSLHARERAIRVYAASTRPARIDKDSLGNCTKLRVFKLGYPEDQDAMRRALGVPLEAVAELKKLQFIERDTDSGALYFGELRFSGRAEELELARRTPGEGPPGAPLAREPKPGAASKPPRKGARARRV